MASEPIPQQVKGGPLILTRRPHANQAISILNALGAMRVSPAGTGEFVITDTDATLDLSPLSRTMNTRLEALEQAHSALASMQNVITAALANATITCNANGTITITLPHIVQQLMT